MKSLYNSQPLYIGNTAWRNVQQGITDAPKTLYAFLRRRAFMLAHFLGRRCDITTTQAIRYPDFNELNTH